MHVSDVDSIESEVKLMHTRALSHAISRIFNRFEDIKEGNKKLFIQEKVSEIAAVIKHTL
jgi:hypothetical protein